MPAPLKKPTNLSLSVDVLAEAKALGINISRECDQFLRDRVSSEKNRRWKEEHAAFVSAYNLTVEDEGLPLSPWQNF